MIVLRPSAVLAALFVASTSLPPGGMEAGRLALSLLFGAIVGFSLGLTGGGGSIFAVPLLVYGLGVPPGEAAGISLAAVGATALVGCLHRLRAGEVEVVIGLIFAVAGMLGAPVGAEIGRLLPGPLLLVLFAILMVAVAARMWLRASKAARPRPSHTHADGPPTLTGRKAIILSGVGLVTGVFSGLFGVGGGFIIVPALVTFGGVGIHRAVATSMLVIALIGASGVSASLAAGRPLAIGLTAQFVLGGLIGLTLGTRLGRRLSGPRLQKIFAGAILAVAAFVLARNLV